MLTAIIIYYYHPKFLIYFADVGVSSQSWKKKHTLLRVWYVGGDCM